MPTSILAKSRHKPPMKVLLVEDSALLRDVVAESFKDCKQISIGQFSATQSKAIELLDTEQFDMLLVDIELAEGNGFEVIKHTQASNYPFKAPILVVLTNNAHPHYRKFANELGVDYFFDKSMDFELAIEIIISEAEKFSLA